MRVFDCKEVRRHLFCLSTLILCMACGNAFAAETVDEALKTQLQREARYDAELEKIVAGHRTYMKQVMEKEYTTSSAVDNGWTSWLKRFKSGFRYNEISWSFENPETKEKLTKLNNERKAKRAKILDQLTAEYITTKRAYAIKLTKASLKLGDPMNAQWVLRYVYMENANTVDEELKALAEETAKAYGPFSFERFKKFGGVGVYDRGNGGTVFALKPFAKGAEATLKPADVVYYVEGEQEIHLLCRLPRPAKAYANRINATLHVQLISNNQGFKFAAASQTIGSPKALGDAQYIQASFKLPPKKFEKNTRWYFKGQILLTYNVPLIAEQKQEVLADSGGFFWHR